MGINTGLGLVLPDHTHFHFPTPTVSSTPPSPASDSTEHLQYRNLAHTQALSINQTPEMAETEHTYKFDVKVRAV